MPVTTPISLRHFPRRALAAGLLFGVLSCDSGPTGPDLDTVPPVTALTPVPLIGRDSIVVSLLTQDNLGIKNIHVAFSGAVLAVFDTTFGSPVTADQRSISVSVPGTAPVGALITAVASATDGAGNVSRPDTLRMAVGNVPAPTVQVLQPLAGSSVQAGRSLSMVITSTSSSKISLIGVRIAGAVVRTDSVVFQQSVTDSATFADTVLVPLPATPATLTLTPFMIDGLGQAVTGHAISLSVQSGSSSVPTVSQGVTSRVEVSDTIRVQASDAIGVSAVGVEAFNLSGALLFADSVAATPTSTYQTARLQLRLAPWLNQTLVVRAFARNTAGLRGTSSTSDTVRVVAGTTRLLPNGGRIADALYYPKSDRLYLSNMDRNALEVFNLADSTFGASILVGSKPWGIAAWPADHLGNMGDTLVVANSGGTQLSYVSASSAREVGRYALPNIVAYSVTSTTSSTSGQVIQQRTQYDFSDRPQYLAMTCGPAAGSACGDVIAVYSTTPTGGQSLPFPNAGTLRSENLTRQSSHLFFEQAIGQTTGRSDTLEVVRLAAGGIGSDSVLVPYQQPATDANGKATTFSVVVQIDKLGFRDTTFVRSSGDFARAVFGEGGQVNGSRALLYDARAGMAPTVGGLTLSTPVIDRGVSRAADASDYIANAFAKVSGVAMNFDGSLAAVRGDSTYLFDRTLRLQGLLPTSGSAGFDFHPRNTGLNSSPLATRLAFAAAAGPQIEVYDTYCYAKVGTIEVREPIIGPIKSAVRPNGTVVLIGATQSGVVLVTVPASMTTSCQ